MSTVLIALLVLALLGAPAAYTYVRPGDPSAPPVVSNAPPTWYPYGGGLLVVVLLVLLLTRVRW